MSSKYAIPDDARQVIGSPRPEGEAIQLPFVAPLVWWTNGRPERRPEDGILYTGGWAMKGVDYDLAVAEYGQLPYWQETLTDMTGDMGRLYETEYIAVAPFAGRRKWLDKEKGDDYTGGWLQELCLMGYLDSDASTFVPWGPIVVSTKVYAAKRFGQFINDWSMMTADARKKYAGGRESWYFFMSVGHFGDEPKFVTRGKSNTATYSLPVLYEYDEVTEAILDMTFVGSGSAAKMAAWKIAADEWIHDKAWRDDPLPEESGNQNENPYPADPYEGKRQGQGISSSSPAPPPNFP